MIRTIFHGHARLLALLATLLLFLAPAAAQDPEPARETEAAIEVEDTGPQLDTEIRERLQGIYAEIPALAAVEITVSAGVVSLSGTVPDNDSLAQAENIASRVTGVVAVRNGLARDVSVGGRLNPAGNELRSLATDTITILPLLAVALLVFSAFLLIGLFLASRDWLLDRLTPNTFIAGMVAAMIRVVFIAIGLIVALRILDAVALLSAFLGAAGVIGLAVGFAVRDSIENFIASIMLSLRQPFRPNDLVCIGEHMGHVVRLTSRATILMTPDGNHLRIPNATVFKAVIENFTRNPERRFSFQLGIDAEDDPKDAIDVAIDHLNQLPFVLADPPASGWIEEVGDSNIVLTLTGWINQADHDFNKSRSQAIRVAKTVLENEGFTLPEPIYRLKIDQVPAMLAQQTPATPAGSETAAPKKPAGPSTREVLDDAIDTTVDTSLAEKVEADRATADRDDLLSDEAPTEYGDKGQDKDRKGS